MDFSICMIQIEPDPVEWEVWVLITPFPIRNIKIFKDFTVLNFP